MLRYYSYYSVGGYKDFILGTSEDKQEATYYLPLLPVLEERAKTDEDAAKQRLQEFFFHMQDISLSTNILKEIIMLWL